MQEQFVPYELALELKKLGFNEECFGFYTEEYEELILNRSKLPIDLPSKPFLAPLWQQAFDWFRKEHEYDLNWKPMSIVGITMYYDVEIHHPTFVWDKPPKVTGRTHKEVSLNCLKKLIELQKNPQPLKFNLD